LETTLADGSPDLEMRYWLLWGLANLTLQAGDLDAGRMYILQAGRLCESWPDSREAARNWANLAAVERRTGNAKASVECGERAVGLARQARTSGRQRVLALALLNLAGSLLRWASWTGPSSLQRRAWRSLTSSASPPCGGWLTGSASRSSVAAEMW